MKHIIHKFLTIVKNIFFFFRVIVTLEIGKSGGENKDPRNEDSEEGDIDGEDI